jgi:type II secretory pathway pseudopilin PulG
MSSIGKIRMWHIGQRGDTIVEVLISIAVISLVLGGAYVTTNTSLMSTRAAQEQGDALKLVEGQIEQIKGAVNDGVAATSLPGSGFCMRNGVAESVPANCKVKADSTLASGSTQPAYQISITRNTNKFTITNRWITVAGDNSSVQMTYRVY